MGKVRVDERGRITLPKEVRESLRVESGEEMEIRVVDGEIHLAPEERPVEKVRASKSFGPDAFLDAGEATFGE